MKMKLNALTLAVAAAGAIGTAAHADSVALFPYVVYSPSVTTLVSVIDTGASTVNYSGNTLHWRLHYKTKAEDNAATCKEKNKYFPTSTNDLQTVDLSGTFGAATKGVLFNDPGTKAAWKGISDDFMLAKLAMNETGEKAMRGLLFVHNNDDTAATGNSLYGEAMVLELGSGAAWGYEAVRMRNDGQDYNFGGSGVSHPYIANTQSGQLGKPVALMPTDQVRTMLFVTPMTSAILPDNGLTPTNSGPWTNVSAKLNYQVLSNGTVTTGFYDRDEGFTSGVTDDTITCVGAVELSKKTPYATQGGWTNVAISGNTASGVTPAEGAYLIKLEYSLGTPVNGERALGIFNNAFMLR